MGRARVVTVAATVLSPLLFGLGVQVLPHAGRPGPAAVAAQTASPSPRGATLWLNPGNPAAAAIRTTERLRPADAVLLRKIATTPQSTWLGDWLTPANATRFVADRAALAAAAQAVPVFVLYAIPARDCGSYSRGGHNSPEAYRAWVRAVVAGLKDRRAIVVVEPDALPGLDCLTQSAQRTRLELIAYAVDRLRTNPRLSVYLDVGSARWHSAAVMAPRLRAAGIARARGIATNVAGFDTTPTALRFARDLSRQLGRPLPVVIDTSRNGNGRWTARAAQTWCNPPGRALGQRPTTRHPDPQVDALLWVKTPGLSDGSCRGGPAAGQWYSSYALTLARNASW